MLRPTKTFLPEQVSRSFKLNCKLEDLCKFVSVSIYCLYGISMKNYVRKKSDCI